MRPDVTFLTSSELQSIIGNDLDEDGMAELRRFRDRVLDRFGEHRDVLEIMEALYGRDWYSMDQRVWIFDGAHDSISSPILLRKGDLEETVFDAFWNLAKQLIRETPPESELVAPGYKKIDAVSALLAEVALERSGVGGDLIEAARSESSELKTWRAVDDMKEDWDPDEEGLYDWVEGR